MHSVMLNTDHSFILSVKISFFFLLIPGLELRAYTLNHSTSPFFVNDFFQDGVWQTICLGWIQTAILLSS
jgi:hypothetical protein